MERVDRDLLVKDDEGTRGNGYEITSKESWYVFKRREEIQIFKTEAMIFVMSLGVEVVQKRPYMSLKLSRIKVDMETGQHEFRSSSWLQHLGKQNSVNTNQCSVTIHDLTADKSFCHVKGRCHHYENTGARTMLHVSVYINK